jgi:hypothetical protein
MNHLPKRICDRIKQLVIKATQVRHLGLVPVIASFLVGATGSPRADPSCESPASVMARVELFLGTGGGETPRAFRSFLAREVTPRFPDGLSLFEGYGQWRDSSNHITHERSRLLLIYYRADAASDAKIEAIRVAYKKRFHQKSVLRADSAACVEF